jgi:uncharacterized protein
MNESLRPRRTGGTVLEMEPRLSLVTLGVADLARARTFYERLGWRGQEVEETVFFQAGGIGLVLWGRDKLAADAGVPDGDTAGFGGIVLAHNVRSAPEVDELLIAAEQAGGRITQAARATPYGRGGTFADPDGHLWEIGYNPGFPLDRDGAITIPDFNAS